MSIISSGRVLPCNLDSQLQTSYLVIRGTIQNNERHHITDEWDAPVLKGCPSPFPSEKLGSSLYCPPNTNCEIRLHPVDLTAPPICDPSDPSEGETRYFLPSLALLIKNNVNGTQAIIDPYDAKNNLTGAQTEYEPCAHTYVKCDDHIEKKKVELRQDGILAAVYTINLFNSYKSSLDKVVYEYVICPYTPGDIFSLDNKCLEPSELYDVKDILGTQPFCLGSKEQPCVCVSLLLHGALRDDEDPSLLDCVETDLYWVGVKLYYTNLEGKMCYKNPVCLNITHAPNTPFSECFTPYFAKTEYKTTTTPVSIVDPVCNQKSATCGQIVEQNVAPGGSLQGKVYLGCGVLGETTNDLCDTIQIILISTKVDISEVIHDTLNCSNFIVLLPNTLLTLS